MGYCVDQAVYDWILANEPNYISDPDLFIGQDGETDGLYWFYELPSSLTIVDGQIWTISMRPSQQGVLVGNLID